MPPKSGQNVRKILYEKLIEFDPDTFDALVVGQTIDVDNTKQSVPMHQHDRGQLLTTSKGVVRCETVDGAWNVAPSSALWIPPRRPHRSIVLSGGTIVFLYLAEGAAQLPSTSCFISLTPLAREMVKHLATASPHYSNDSVDGMVARALTSLLESMGVTEPFIPMPHNPRLRRIAEHLRKDPGDRQTAETWARLIGMSEKSLRRLVLSETGLPFLQWRQQFQLIAAVRALRDGASVQDVAILLGYESTTAFSTMFKKAMGTPPGRFSRSADAG